MWLLLMSALCFGVCWLSFVHGKKLVLADYMFCGALATATTDVILYPLDTVKVTQQSSRTPTNFLEALGQVSRSGPGAFFNGALPYATLDGCSAAIFFAIYEEAKFIMSLKLSGPALGLAAYPAAGHCDPHFVSLFIRS